MGTLKDNLDTHRRKDGGFHVIFRWPFCQAMHLAKSLRSPKPKGGQSVHGRQSGWLRQGRSVWFGSRNGQDCRQVHESEKGEGSVEVGTRRNAVEHIQEQDAFRG